MKKLLSLCLLLMVLLPLRAQHSPYIEAVDIYCPAPGQFVNTMPEASADDDAQSMAEKCTALLTNNKQGVVSLGAYGGYIVFHFDHPIVNVSNEYDLFIDGNAHWGSSEPGIVSVSVDENGNGLPDDTWYELRGSADEDSAANIVYNYNIRYEQAPLSDIPWTDNEGNSGTIPRNDWHEQEYFPLWLSSELSFSGTLLPRNGVNTKKNGDEYWVQSPLRYGYVDNDTTYASKCFNIDWAVDENRLPVKLSSIDFVRVYTAINQVCGWIGETSTEISNAFDLHPDAKGTGIRSHLSNNRNEAEWYSLSGTRLQAPAKGINILRIKGKTFKRVRN